MDHHHHHHHHGRTHRRLSAVVTAAPQQPDQQKETGQPSKPQELDLLLTLSKPAGHLVRLAVSQLELFSSSLISLSYPFLSLLYESEAVPYRVARGGGTLLCRLLLGLLGAIHAIAILIALLAVAVVVGVGLVRMWVEEPVVLRRPLHFDYTNAEPSAVVGIGPVIPPGHTVRVYLELLMPESDYNRRIGVFQVTAEVIVSNGDIITSSSQPCMLRFRSLPVRLMRTFIMGIPLVVGMTSESQKISFEVLRYIESKRKSSEEIRVRLKPRAGTTDLPQIYEAEILMNSQLPQRKAIVYNWKWTFYVWISLYVYIMLLIVLVCYFRPFSFPKHSSYQVGQPIEGEKDERFTTREDLSEEFSDAVRKWRERSRSKRRVRHQQGQLPELVEGSASSVTGGETSEVIEDSGEFAASESSGNSGIQN